jgi:DNA-binding transcriptional LysR family regulator
MANWDDMRVFLSVARSESLSGAGLQLKMDPATVGRRIARLEETSGAALFTRSPQGYRLTEAGQRMMEHAVTAEQALLAADDAVRGPDEALSGSVRIGAPDGCANFLLPQICARIIEAHPQLDIQIVALPRVVNLSKREADLAIAVSAPASGRLLVQKICDYDLYLAAMPDYLRRNAPITRPEDLRQHRVVGYIPDMIFDRELDYLSDLGIQQPALASNSVAVQFHWVRSGAGVGVVHGFAMRHAPEMRRLLPDQVRLTRAFYLVRHADDRKVNRLNRLAEMLVAELRREMLQIEDS